MKKTLLFFAAALTLACTQKSPQERLQILLGAASDDIRQSSVVTI